jgi:hypothetical protein
LLPHSSLSRICCAAIQKHWNGPLPPPTCSRPPRPRLLPRCRSHPSPGATLALAVDASDSHVGGVLQQLENRAWRPLAFFSQKLTPTQVRYSTFDRELLAAYSSVRHFRFLLEGRKFRILTDHKPLVSAMTRVTPPWSNRQQRHLSFLAEFTSDLRHTSGSSNVVADALSRPPTNSVAISAAVSGSASAAVVSGSGSAAVVSASGSVSGLLSAAAAVGIKPPAIVNSEADLHASKLSTQPLPPAENSSSVEPLIAAVPAQPQLEPVDFTKLAATQTSCPDVVSMSKSPSLNIVSRPVGDVQLLGDISTGIFRPLVPAVFREQLIRSLHSVHHPGIRATARIIKASFCWPRMEKDITAVARTCMGCQLGKVQRHVTLEPEHIPVPHRRFSHVHVDLVGPLPKSAGFTHLFTVMDRTTRWPEAIPLSSTAAADCAAALFTGWIQRFGVPSTITSDRGPQFTSALWAALCKLLNISHIPTTAYHPQSNGLVERFHRRLKDALRARTAGADWCHHLPWVLLGIRSAWREGTKFSPAEAVYGAQPILPGPFLAGPESPSPTFLDDLQGILSGRTALPTTHHSTPAPQQLPEELLLAKHVLVRRDGHTTPLSAAYDGPFLVLERSLQILQTSSWKQDRHLLYPQAETLPVTSRCSGGAAPTARPPARHPRRPRPICCRPFSTSIKKKTAAPPRDFPMSCRGVVFSTSATPFWPPNTLRRASEAVPRQSQPPPASSTWGGAVGRRPTTTYFQSSEL